MWCRYNYDVPSPYFALAPSFSSSCTIQGEIFNPVNDPTKVNEYQILDRVLDRSGQHCFSYPYLQKDQKGEILSLDKNQATEFCDELKYFQ